MEKLIASLIENGYLNEKCALHIRKFVESHFSENIIRILELRQDQVISSLKSRDDFPGFIDTVKETPEQFDDMKNNFIITVLGREFTEEERMRLTWVFIICIQVICRN